MTTYRFDISQTGYSTIKIEADDGILIDDWKDLTNPSCLTSPAGGFKIHPTEAHFNTTGVLIFKLLDKPFSAAVGDTGDAVLEEFGPSCTNLGWKWKLISKS